MPLDDYQEGDQTRNENTLGAGSGESPGKENHAPMLVPGTLVLGIRPYSTTECA
jgi:hypothetical protein